MKKRGRLCGLILLAVWPCLGQQDFLRADEIDLLREIQEPNERLLLYVKFARERLDLVEQFLAKEAPGRATLVRQTLEQYTKIVDALDMVTDDAVRRGAELDTGMPVVAEAEKEMAARLRKIAGRKPADFMLFQFALEQAIETTEDSLEMALEDLADRAKKLEARDAKEQKERESMMRPEEVEAKRAAEQKEAELKKKTPTLLRPGEVPEKQR